MVIAPPLGFSRVILALAAGSRMPKARRLDRAGRRQGQDVQLALAACPAAGLDLAGRSRPAAGLDTRLDIPADRVVAFVGHRLRGRIQNCLAVGRNNARVAADRQSVYARLVVGRARSFDRVAGRIDGHRLGIGILQGDLDAGGSLADVEGSSGDRAARRLRRRHVCFVPTHSASQHMQEVVFSGAIVCKMGIAEGVGRCAIGQNALGAEPEN